MSAITRVAAVVTIFFGLALYLLFVARGVAPLWSLMQSMEVVRNGPFWSVAQTFKFIATYLVPAGLVISGILVWVVSSIREESNRDVRRVQP